MICRGALTAALLGLALSATALPPRSAMAAQFQADDWSTECAQNGDGDCSIIVPFQSRGSRQVAGSFALAIDMQTGILAIVGQPPPVTAKLQVDKNPPIACNGPRYCLFAGDASLRAVAQLSRGALVLIDVATGQGDFHASLSTKGFRAGLAKIEAWHEPPIGIARQGR